MANIKFVKKANMWMVQTWEDGKQVWKWFVTKEAAEKFNRKQNG